MTPRLPDGFLDRPIAHRALHGPARPENSREAIQAAIAAGYGIEIDIQQSSDGVAMVFHDYGLTRLTGAEGTIQTTPAATLAQTPLLGGATAPPTLAAALALVAGQVPLVIEIKDQDGAMGPAVGPLEAAVADALRDYKGPVAVMSFNPHSVAAMAALSPNIPRGLTTSDYADAGWGVLPAARRTELAQIPDIARTGAAFISHDHRSLDSAPVQALKAQGLPILCWTIRSAEAAEAALKTADQITFEGFSPR